MIGSDQTALLRAARGPLLAGLLLVGGGVVGSLAWAATAPLDSAAIAQGVVVVDGQRKSVEHLEGGIVRQILVREGAAVTAGQPLVILDDTQDRTLLDTLRGQLLALMAEEARLLAERDDAEAVTFDAAAFAGADARVLDAQRAMFDARRATLTSQEDITTRRIAQLTDQKRGLEAQAEAAADQQALLEEELKAAQGLFDKGYERKPRILELRRKLSELGGARGEALAAMAEVEQKIGEARLQVLDLRARLLAEVTERLGSVQTRIAELREQARGLEDRVARAVVRAPRDGVVVDLAVHTEGGVVAPTGRLMDIVPTGDALIVEARLRPEDIDQVRPGLPSEVRLTAYHARTTPTLTGEIALVSADRLEDPRTGEAYYAARVRLSPEALEQAGDLTLQPGMPAEVMIRTGARTALDILVQPLRDSMRRSFREG